MVSPEVGACNCDCVSAEVLLRARSLFLNAGFVSSAIYNNTPRSPIGITTFAQSLSE